MWSIPGRGRFASSSDRARSETGWHQRERQISPFVRLRHRRGEVLRQCAAHLIDAGKWNQLVLLGAIAPTLLLPRTADDGELDPSMYVMY